MEFTLPPAPHRGLLGPSGPGTRRKSLKSAGKSGSQSPNIVEDLKRVNGHGRFGGQIAGGHSEAFPKAQWPGFAVLGVRGLDSARSCRNSWQYLVKGETSLANGDARILVHAVLEWAREK